MTSYQISVAGALNKLKVINARIADAQAQPFAGMAVQGRVGSVSESKFVADATMNLQRVQQLINNRNQLKAKIAESNARTTVTIAGVTMSVASAIEHKSGVEIQETLWRTLNAQLQQGQRQVEGMNTKLQAQAEQEAGRLYATAEDKTGYEQFVSTFVAQRVARLAAPRDFEVIVSRIGAAIQQFKADVDLALTTSNVQTLIEVDFDPQA